MEYAVTEQAIRIVGGLAFLFCHVLSVDGADEGAGVAGQLL